MVAFSSLLSEVSFYVWRLCTCSGMTVDGLPSEPIRHLQGRLATNGKAEPLDTSCDMTSWSLLGVSHAAQASRRGSRARQGRAKRPWARMSRRTGSLAAMTLQKPLHAGLLVQLAFAVGTDAENEQNQMTACGTVCRMACSQNPQMLVADSFTVTQFRVHVRLQRLFYSLF